MVAKEGGRINRRKEQSGRQSVIEKRIDLG
jgi:hypothetical protein